MFEMIFEMIFKLNQEKFSIAKLRMLKNKANTCIKKECKDCKQTKINKINIQIHFFFVNLLYFFLCFFHSCEIMMASM